MPDGTTTADAELEQFEAQRDEPLLRPDVPSTNGLTASTDAPKPAQPTTAPASPTASGNVRRCAECEGPLPAGKRLYCGEACAKAVDARKARQRHKAKPKKTTTKKAAPTPITDQRTAPDVVGLVGRLLANRSIHEIEVDIDGAHLVVRSR